MPPSRSATSVCDLVQALVDQLGVFGHLLDVSQGDPEPAPLDIPDGLGRRALPDLDVAEAGVRERQVSLLASHRFGWQPVGELRDSVDREQRMVGKAVSHGDRPPCERVRECRGVDINNTGSTAFDVLPLIAGPVRAEPSRLVLTRTNLVSALRIRQTVHRPGAPCLLLRTPRSLEPPLPPLRYCVLAAFAFAAVAGAIWLAGPSASNGAENNPRVPPPKRERRPHRQAASSTLLPGRLRIRQDAADACSGGRAVPGHGHAATRRGQ